MIFLVFFSTFLFLYFLDKKTVSLLKSSFDIEAERLTTNIVNQALNDLSYKVDYSSILQVDRNSNGEIEKLSYNTVAINQLNDTLTDCIQKKLKELEIGKIDESLFFDDYIPNQFHKIKNGILCEVRLGSLRGSSLFANVGPVIPIRLQFLGQVDPDIDIQVEEYGINTILVKLLFIAKIKERISRPFSSNQKEIIINYPLSIDIISGSIPNRYNEFSKSNNT